jgi:serine/threonine-protein kinase
MRHTAGWGDAPWRPEQGLRLGGRYELRRRIAVGGMGEVWLSRDLSLDRSVATKVLREELAGDDRFLARLRAEARTSAPLAHPNIAALYDYGEHAGSGYLVMELVPGQTLSQLLARERVLAPETLLPILAQAARALHAAHVCGVVHRDVKPSNILLTREGEVKITDFGISCPANYIDDSAAGTVMGTAQYLSPEQAMGRPATPASDVYGLGVVAYEALAGRIPFTGPSLVDIATAHVNDPVPPLPTDLPEQVRAIVVRMLEKNPERRPRSAASLARTLERIAAELELARPFDVGAPAPPAPAPVPDVETEAFDVGALLAAEALGVPPPGGPAVTGHDGAEGAPEARGGDGPDPEEGADPEDGAEEPPWLPTGGTRPPTEPGGAGEAVGPGGRQGGGTARRPAHARARARRRWGWAVLVVTVAIATMAVLSAGRLLATADGAGPTVGAHESVDSGPAGAGSAPRGDSRAGAGPSHRTQIEVSSW